MGKGQSLETFWKVVAKQIAHAIRSHRGLENGLRWVLGKQPE